MYLYTGTGGVEPALEARWLKVAGPASLGCLLVILAEGLAVDGSFLRLMVSEFEFWYTSVVAGR